MSLTQAAAEELLRQLKVQRPEQIDVDQVAEFLDAEVVYDAPPGRCANLVGYGDCAKIMVNPEATVERQRFSIAHELGHWLFDWGNQVSLKHMTAAELRVAEKRADAFAGDLVLPDYLVRPQVQEIDVDFASIEELRQLFRTSLTATTIKLIQCTPSASMFCCYSIQGDLKWQIASPSFPLHVRPHRCLRFATAAARSLEHRVPPQVVPLGAWFPGAPTGHEIREESVLSTRYQVILSVLRWPDGQPITASSAA